MTNEFHSYTNIYGAIAELLEPTMQDNLVAQARIVAKVITARMENAAIEQASDISSKAVRFLYALLQAGFECPELPRLATKPSDCADLEAALGAEDANLKKLGNMNFREIGSMLPKDAASRFKADSFMAEFYNILMAVSINHPEMTVKVWANEYAMQIVSKYFDIIRDVKKALHSVTDRGILGSKKDDPEKVPIAALNCCVNENMIGLDVDSLGTMGTANYLEQAFCHSGRLFTGGVIAESTTTHIRKDFMHPDDGNFDWVRDVSMREFGFEDDHGEKIGVKAYLHSQYNDFYQFRYFDQKTKEIIATETIATTAVLFVDIDKLERDYDKPYAKALATVALYDGNYYHLPILIAPSMSYKVIKTPLPVDEFKPVFIPVRLKNKSDYEKIYDDVTGLISLNSKELFDVYTIDTSGEYFGINFEVLSEMVTVTDEYLKEPKFTYLPWFDPTIGKYVGKQYMPPTCSMELIGAMAKRKIDRLAKEGEGNK